MTDNQRHFMLEIEAAFAGVRLDKALSQLLPDHSRGTIQQWLKQGLVRVGGEPVQQRFPLAGGEHVEIFMPEPQPADWLAQDMQLDIIHRDHDLLVINKPAGLVVHPGAGQPDRTLLNGLLHIDDALRTLPRGGIVHRLDKDTSGLLVVARNEMARQRLIAQLQSRSMKRRYLAVANGVMVAGERIEQPIGRHRRERVRMCVTPSGKPAITHIRVARKFRSHCLIRAELESGRTHQIRVHLSWRGFPLVGDKLYGGRLLLPPKCSDELTMIVRHFPRQALHATHLSLCHPGSGEISEWHQPPPADFQQLVDQLEQDCRRNQATD